MRGSKKLKRKPSVWVWPIWLGVSMCAGLTSALFGEAVWDAVSWLLLLFPVVVGFYFWRSGRENEAESRRAL